MIGYNVLKVMEEQINKNNYLLRIKNVMHSIL